MWITATVERALAMPGDLGPGGAGAEALVDGEEPGAGEPEEEGEDQERPVLVEGDERPTVLHRQEVAQEVGCRHRCQHAQDVKKTNGTFDDSVSHGLGQPPDRCGQR